MMEQNKIEECQELIGDVKKQFSGVYNYAGYPMELGTRLEVLYDTILRLEKAIASLGSPTNGFGRGAKYPDFSEWKKNAIQIKPGLVFAPEDFYIAKDGVHRTEYFDSRDALELEKKILMPNGWRLPNKWEWEEAIPRYFGLNLGLNGGLWPSEQYAYSHDLGSFSPYNRGKFGYYLSSTFYDRVLMYGLNITTHTAFVSCDFPINNGYSISGVAC